MRGMSTSADLRKPPLPVPVLIILGLHAMGAVGVGVAGVVTADGSDGFGDLALVVSIMLASLWFAGVFLSWAASRYLVANRWVRLALATFGPLVGVVALMLVARG